MSKACAVVAKHKETGDLIHFGSIQEAASQFGVTSGVISKACVINRYPCHGYYWYKESEFEDEA